MKRYLLGFLTVVASLAVYADSKARSQALGGHGDSKFGSSLADTIDRGDEKRFNLLVKQKQSEKDVREALEKAASNESTKYLKSLLANQAFAKDFASKDGSIFLTALSDGNLEMVKSLEGIVDVSGLKYENGNSALHEAVTYANIDVIKHIADKNPALVSKLNDQGESILFSAVRRGNRKMVDEILKLKGLPAERKNKKGETAESVALALGYKRIAEKVK